MLNNFFSRTLDNRDENCDVRICTFWTTHAGIAEVPFMEGVSGNVLKRVYAPGMYGKTPTPVLSMHDGMTFLKYQRVLARIPLQLT